MKTELQKLGTTSEKKEFVEPIHSESSFQEAETTSEKTEFGDQIISKNSSQEAETKISSDSGKKIIILKWRRYSEN